MRERTAAMIMAAALGALAAPGAAQTVPRADAPSIARAHSGAVMMSWRVIGAKDDGHVEVTCPSVALMKEPNGARVLADGHPVALLRGGTAVWHRPAISDDDGSMWYSVGYANDAVTGVVPARCVREI